MIIILLIGFNSFVSSSISLGNAEKDVPSGFSLTIGGKHKVNYDFIGSYYSKSNYEIKLFGIAMGKELFLGRNFSFLPELGMAKCMRSRRGVSEDSFIPVLLVRFTYLFTIERSTFQIGFSLREVFNGEMGADFIDLGVGFRM